MASGYQDWLQAVTSMPHPYCGTCDNNMERNDPVQLSEVLEMDDSNLDDAPNITDRVDVSPLQGWGQIGLGINVKGSKIASDLLQGAKIGKLLQLGSDFEHLTANASFKVLLDIIQGLMGALTDPPEHWGRLGLSEQDWELLRDRDFWADQPTQAAQHAHKF